MKNLKHYDSFINESAVPAKPEVVARQPSQDLIKKIVDLINSGKYDQMKTLKEQPSKEELSLVSKAIG